MNNLKTVKILINDSLRKGQYINYLCGTRSHCGNEMHRKLSQICK